MGSAQDIAHAVIAAVSYEGTEDVERRAIEELTFYEDRDDQRDAHHGSSDEII